MFIAHCYNWNAGDDFMAIGQTENEAINTLSKAYQNYYDMSYKDVVEMHRDSYESFEEYLTEYQEMRVYELNLGEVAINYDVRKENEL